MQAAWHACTGHLRRGQHPMRGMEDSRLSLSSSTCTAAQRSSPAWTVARFARILHARQIARLA